MSRGLYLARVKLVTSLSFSSHVILQSRDEERLYRTSKHLEITSITTSKHQRFELTSSAIGLSTNARVTGLYPFKNAQKNCRFLARYVHIYFN
jgi:hypothetical protein